LIPGIQIDCAILLAFGFLLSALLALELGEDLLEADLLRFG
jgi:hypothetical protein